MLMPDDREVPGEGLRGKNLDHSKVQLPLALSVASGCSRAGVGYAVHGLMESLPAMG